MPLAVDLGMLAGDRDVVDLDIVVRVAADPDPFWSYSDFLVL
jgi:hypothetical protein